MAWSLSLLTMWVVKRSLKRRSFMSWANLLSISAFKATMVQSSPMARQDQEKLILFKARELTAQIPTKEVKGDCYPGASSTFFSKSLRSRTITLRILPEAARGQRGCLVSRFYPSLKTTFKVLKLMSGANT